MQTEIEVKFLNADHTALRAKLEELGATLKQPERLMRRKNLDFPDRRLDKELNGWIRVRDEGDKITLSYKQVNDRTLHGTKEVNVIVDDFDTTCQFLEAIGITVKTYQETKRESWLLDDVQIELDEWPWVPAYVELEGPNEAAVKQVAESLGFAMKDGVHGSVEIVYRDIYDVTDDEVNSMDTIVFGPVPEWLEKRRKSEKA